MQSFPNLFLPDHSRNARSISVIVTAPLPLDWSPASREGPHRRPMQRFDLGSENEASDGFSPNRVSRRIVGLPGVNVTLGPPIGPGNDG
jgi:hypothetical protein